jgi:hypothetical protein
LVYPAKLVKNVNVGRVNPAFEELGEESERLGISPKFTKSDIKQIEIQLKCREHIHKVTNIKNFDVDFIKDVIAPKILEYVATIVPKWAKDVYGFAKGLVPKWMKTLAAKSLSVSLTLTSSPLILMIATLIYTVLKGTICIYTLPGSSINLALDWLKNQARTANKSLEVFIAISDALFNCSTTLTGCLMSAFNLFSKLIGASFSWISLTISYFLPLQTDFNNLKTYKVSFFQSWARKYSDMGDVVLNSNAIDTKVFQNVIAQMFPTAGIKLMRFILFDVFGSFLPPGYKFMFDQFKKVIDMGISTYAQIRKALDQFKGAQTFYLLLQFAYREVENISRCLIMRENCCFSEDIVTAWKYLLDNPKKIKDEL